MKRIVCMAVLAVVMLLAAAPVADAHPDYRPWKAAMFEWYEDYAETVWLPAVNQAWADGTYTDNKADFNFPPGIGTGMDSPVNRWDDPARTCATVITAIEGPFPCERFSKRLRDILRPYLKQRTVGDAWTTHARSLVQHR